MLTRQRPDTLNDPRFFTTEELHESFVRVNIGALRSISFLMRHLDKEDMLTFLSDLMGNVQLWAKLKNGDFGIQLAFHQLLIELVESDFKGNFPDRPIMIVELKC